jgi:hypothetical protein
MSVRRSSRQIMLVLIGTAALPACSPTPAPVHDRYASLEDCTADWGRPEACDREPASGTAAGGTGGGPWSGRGFVFRGPDYRAGDRALAQYEARDAAVRLGALQSFEAGPTSHAIEHAVPSASRGGFGSLSHVFGRLG